MSDEELEKNKAKNSNEEESGLTSSEEVSETQIGEPDTNQADGESVGVDRLIDETPKPPGLPGPDVNLDVILDVPLTISMEVGRTKITIRNLLQLNQGSVVELDRVAGEHLDVMVNGTLVAHGEVVVVNEKFGIRLTDVISPLERIKNLKP